MLCPLMQLDFMDGTGRFDEAGAERYTDDDLRYGIMWAEHYIADGYKNEPMAGFDLEAFRKWCTSSLPKVHT